MKSGCLNVTRESLEYNISNSNEELIWFDFGEGSKHVQHNYSWWFIAPMVIILAIVSIASVVGNGLVVATIARHRGMRTRTNLLLANLAAADILVGALDMPFSLVALINGNWRFGFGACQFNAFTTGLALMASIHTLMFISIHKYISMTRPFSRAMTPLRISMMAASVWLWSCLYNTLPFLGVTSNVYKRGATQCGPIVPCTPSQKIHSFLNTFMNFLVPLIVMSFCNFKISRAVGEHMGRMRQTSNMNYRNSVLQQKHITVTLVIVMVCFLTCWSPYIIYSCTLVFKEDEKAVPLILNPIVYWCGYVNSACNPIIYAFRSPSFRQGYMEILCRSRGGRPIVSTADLVLKILIIATNLTEFTHPTLMTAKFRKLALRLLQRKLASCDFSFTSKGAPWTTSGGAGDRKSRKQWEVVPRHDVLVRHQLLPNSDAASRAVLHRLACRSLAQGVLQPSRSSPNLNLKKKRNSAEAILRRCDTDTCLAVASIPIRTESNSHETQACSFHTIPDENQDLINPDIVKVIVTDVDEEGLTYSTPCLKTENAYVIAIEGDQTFQNGNVHVIVTEPSNGVSKNSLNKSTDSRIRPSSLLVIGLKNRSAVSLQEVKTEQNRTRRFTEAQNRHMPAPTIENKFHSDPGGLAPKRLGSVENFNSKKKTKASPSPTNTPLLRNVAPKWRLSVEGLDKSLANRTVAATKSSGIRGSILALLGKGQT